MWFYSAVRLLLGRLQRLETGASAVNLMVTARRQEVTVPDQETAWHTTPHGCLSSVLVFKLSKVNPLLVVSGRFIFTVQTDI